jgi:radical SAM-linked protein
MSADRPENPPDTPVALVPALPPVDPRQRWRLTYERAADDSGRTHRDIATEWQGRLAAAGLPLSTSAGRGRQALSFGAPLPVGMAAERELADLVLVERLPAWDVRARVADSMPDGLRLLAIHDVWLGDAPIAAAVAGADYRVALAGLPADDVPALAGAAADLLAAASIPWQRTRGGGGVAINVRPLIEGIEVIGGDPVLLRLRCRIHPERGAGRPDEVVAVLADRAGRPLTVASTVREAVLLADEMAAGRGE